MYKPYRINVTIMEVSYDAILYQRNIWAAKNDYIHFVVLTWLKGHTYQPSRDLTYDSGIQGFIKILGFCAFSSTN